MLKFSIIADFGYYLEIAQAGFVQSLNDKMRGQQGG
jgi:hypothetical protein